MKCKLILEHDCAKKAVLSMSPVDFLIINKAVNRLSVADDVAEIDRKTALQMVEAFKNFEVVETADRKTENSSEKPNKPTISKMEQVETEPQTDCADTNLSGKPTDSTRSKMEQVETEPQTDCSWK